MKVPDRQKPKILVVDDEPDNLDLLYRTFHRDFKVLRAEGGPAALEILAQEPNISVIISDQRMPYMSGTEFLKLAAAQYPDIIRIILTGYTDVEDLVEAINSGNVFRYVTKPWDDQELKGVVQQALDTHNLLKTRTRELTRTLRQESLLNAVTNTIRGALNYRQIPQTIVDTLGPMFEVSACVLQTFQDERFENAFFSYQKADLKAETAKAEALDQNLWTHTVWQTLDVEVIQDVTVYSHLQAGTVAERSRWQAYQDADIRSSLVVPLICRRDLMAVLALHQCGEVRTWQDDEIQLLITVADQAALALSQAQSYEQARASAKREVLINTITTAIRSSLDPQQIFAAITQQLGQALQVDGCALSLWTEEDEYVQCVGLHDAGIKQEVPLPDQNPASANTPARQLPQSLVPIDGNPVLQQLLTTQQPVVIDDLDDHPGMKSVFDLPLKSPARALLVVPLLSDGKIIGSISLRQTDQPRRWETFDIDLALAVAAQAAIAVQQSRLYQKTRQQAEQLLELDRQKTEFFQNISHEFRTPLTLMIGPLEAVVSRQQPMPYEQAAIALRNSRRLLRLVNQLLDLQRLDAKRMQPNFRPCNLVEFVSQIVESFRPYCEKKGLTLVTEFGSCPSIYLDLERFDKVIYNLLSNAMKFTSAGGTITVSLQPAGGHSILKVKDTGIGIRPDQIPHLFERFRQAEGSVSRSYEGSGLGLALMKELVELHGGQITVDSVYGEGTTFTVWLRTGTNHLPQGQVIEVPTEVPIEVQPGRAAVELADLDAELQEDSAHQNGAGSHEASLSEVDISALLRQAQAANAAAVVPGSALILVVDDNPDLRNYVSGVLQQAGYQVCLARNGGEAFQVAQAQRPQLIVTDLMMPMVSGLDLIRMIRGQEDLKGTPIVLLTAKVDEDTRLEGVE
ncbi:MAG: response regulator, partial [Leptolyngbyaceae bacterium]|nr:response regulator [Leptolyngbyaceae bacterium]